MSDLIVEAVARATDRPSDAVNQVADNGIRMPGALEKMQQTPTHQKDDDAVNYVDDIGDVGGQPCDACSYFVNNTCRQVVGPIAPRGHCDLWEPSVSGGNVGMTTMSMFISKASYIPETKEMRFTAVASNEKEDAYRTQMTLELFGNFIKHIEKGDKVPEIFRSEYWEGGLPYVSLSHYLDLGGFAVVGVAREVFVAGNRLKTRGIFKNDQNPELARAAYEAVKRDIRGNVPDNERIRISIQFLDLRHVHVDSGFQFERPLENPLVACTACEARSSLPLAERELVHFLDGILVHEALTRVPATPETEIVLEERAMKIKTQDQDAASIVGEDLASKVKKRALELGAVERSGALVIKSKELEPEPVTPIIVQATTATVATVVETVPVVVPEQRSDEQVVQVEFAENYDNYPLGGAVTMDAAQAYLVTRKKVQDLTSDWWTLQDVIWNIFDRDDISDKKAALSTAVESFKGMLQTRALTALAFLERSYTEATLEPIIDLQGVQAMPDPIPHALDIAFAAIRSQYDTVLADPTLSYTQKLEKLQTPANDLGATIKRNVQMATPQTSQDITETVQQAVTAALQAMLPQMAVNAAAAAATHRSAVSGDPLPRQAPAPSMIQLQAPAPAPAATQQATNPVQVPGATSALTAGAQQQRTQGQGQERSFINDLVRRSVLGKTRAESGVGV